MKNYHNIEKSGFLNRQYVGYSADGRSWKISGCTGNWSAYANVTCQGSISIIAGFERLNEISKELENIK